MKDLDMIFFMMWVFCGMFFSTEDQCMDAFMAGLKAGIKIGCGVELKEEKSKTKVDNKNNTATSVSSSLPSTIDALALDSEDESDDLDEYLQVLPHKGVRYSIKPHVSFTPQEEQAIQDNIKKNQLFDLIN